MIRSTLLIAAASVALSGGLAGCALLASPDPVQLYRFGGASAYAGTGATSACPDVHVAMRRVDFPEAARGDRLQARCGQRVCQPIHQVDAINIGQTRDPLLMFQGIQQQRREPVQARHG